MLSAGEIAGLRAAFEQTFDETCTIKRLGEVNDGGGRRIASYTTVATTACVRAPYDSQGREGTQGDRVTPSDRWILTLPSGTDVRSSDRLVVGDTTYEVVAVRGARTWEITRRVECERVG